MFIKSFWNGIGSTASLKRYGLARVLTRSVVVTVSATALCSGSYAQANSGATYSVEVPVTGVSPVVEERTIERPERRCEPVRNGRPDRVEHRGTQTYYRGHRYDAPRDSYREPRRGGVGAQILGGLIGGAIGNQFGGGNGKKALTIAGALIGSSVARGPSERDRYYSRSRERRYSPDYSSGASSDYSPDYVCRTTYSTRTVEDVVGYDVTYRYNDALHTRRMDYDPGDTLQIRIRAIPDAGQINTTQPPRRTL